MAPPPGRARQVMSAGGPGRARNDPCALQTTSRMPLAIEDAALEAVRTANAAIGSRC